MFAQYSIVLEHLMFENTGTAQYLYEEDNIVKVKYEIDGVEEKMQKSFNLFRNMRFNL